MRIDRAKLQRTRLSCGLTQARLALLAQVDQYEISRLETGARIDSVGAKVTRIVEALNYIEAKAAEAGGRQAVHLSTADLYDRIPTPEDFAAALLAGRKGRDR